MGSNDSRIAVAGSSHPSGAIDKGKRDVAITAYRPFRHVKFVSTRPMQFDETGTKTDLALNRIPKLSIRFIFATTIIFYVLSPIEGRVEYYILTG